MRPDECRECGAPVAIVHEYTMVGYGFGPPKTECIVEMARVQCAAGHWYDIELGSVEVTP
jgi:hypothetical protein